MGSVLLTAGCAGGDTPTSTSNTTSAATTSPRDSWQASAEYVAQYPTLPPVPEPTAATTTCSYPSIGGGVGNVATPSSSATATGTVEVTLDTTIGPVTLVLDRAMAPCTVNSFLSLARQGFFSDTSCHRLSMNVGAQLYQCGDPTGTGLGNPGYTYADEYPVTSMADTTSVVYPRGTVALSDSGRADTNGSQFFLLLGDSVLRPDYTVFGHVSDASLAVLDAAAAQGDDGSSVLGGGVPNVPVTIAAVR
ncbi:MULTISPECIES: peptidylprolyl isomerase [Rhodococcus]|uniref:peptidylprolyl isomerase n=1 Tax=Rhodococcus TaxID=1827 RepID=UPI001CF90690|nr:MULTISPECIES: peptidylprolyl isomerase [Rhodococcus]